MAESEDQNDYEDDIYIMVKNSAKDTAEELLGPK